MGKPDGKRKAASSGKDGQATPSKHTRASQDPASVDSRLDKIVSAIEHLTEKVDQLESMVHLSDPSAISDSVSQGDKATSSARNMVSLASPNATTDSHTLSDLRMLDSLNARVDNVMGSKATEDVAEGLLQNLGGKHALKSPRDHSYRRVKVNTIWPHQFVHCSGDAQLKFDSLTIQEFVAGTTAIVNSNEISATEKSARLQHLRQLMHLVKTFTWESVRSLYVALLEDIQYGVRHWEQPQALSELKDELLSPADLRNFANIQHSVNNQRKNSKTTPNPCQKFNYHPQGCDHKKPRG